MSTVRADRESPASVPETALARRARGPRGWFPALLRQLGGKAPASGAATDPLLAFPSETTAAPETSAASGEVARPAKGRTAARFLRPVAMAVVALALLS